MATRVFISQPMTGQTEIGIDTVRNEVLVWLPRVLGNDAIVEIPKMPRWQSDSSHPIYCLGHSIQNMSRANLVIFVPGWETARGCVVEHEICVKYNLPYIELEIVEGGYEIVYDGREV